MSATPVVADHLRPEACYVCGYGAHADTTARGGHRYWSNEQAERDFAAESRHQRVMRAREALYVAQYRPY